MELKEEKVKEIEEKLLQILAYVTDVNEEQLFHMYTIYDNNYDVNVSYKNICIRSMGSRVGGDIRETNIVTIASSLGTVHLTGFPEDLDELKQRYQYIIAFPKESSYEISDKNLYDVD